MLSIEEKKDLGFDPLQILHFKRQSGTLNDDLLDFRFLIV
jgi:hypothetical protein